MLNNLTKISLEVPELPNFNSEKAVVKFFDKKNPDVHPLNQMERGLG